MSVFVDKAVVASSVRFAEPLGHGPMASFNGLVARRIQKKSDDGS